MILVTVGMQLGFDRLIKAMDEIAPTLDEPVIAQIGPGAYEPHQMEAHRNIAASEFETLARQARLIVAHAGIGSVLTAQRAGTPIVLFPRNASFGEHRNDHQVATAKQLRRRSGIYVAEDPAQLAKIVHQSPANLSTPPGAHQPSSKLLEEITKFIQIG